MRATRLLAFFVATFCIATMLPAQSLTTVYSNDFQAPPGTEWSNRSRNTTPVGARTFLGRFGGQPNTLTLTDLPDHCSVTVSYELFIIGSWEGSVGTWAGPDVWDMNVAIPGPCCPLENLLHTTFANCSCRFQAYPETYPDVHNPGLNGADEINTLGYDADSVYDLEFTFFHDDSELLLSFAGTPNLQGVDDESWGIDNIVVQVDSESCCRATRELPPNFGAGFSLPVVVEVTPNPTAQAYVVEENPPADWLVFGINEGGIFDGASGLIKWGPFFGNEPRTLTYEVLVPSGRADPFFFSGAISVDGDSEPTCGEFAVTAGSTHPADTDLDFEMASDELTRYGAAWLNGEPWPVQPSPIPANLVTNAGVLWRAGGSYVFDPSTMPPWKPVSGQQTKSGRVDSDLDFPSPAGTVAVELSVVPDAGTLSYIVMDGPPVGWAVSDISHSGRFEAESRTVRWGPFFDDDLRTLSYTLTEVGTEGAPAALAGIASFDGTSVAIGGERMLDDGMPTPRTEEVVFE